MIEVYTRIDLRLMHLELEDMNNRLKELRAKAYARELQNAAQSSKARVDRWDFSAALRNLRDAMTALFTDAKRVVDYWLARRIVRREMRRRGGNKG
jgi:hypothetical protein